MIWDAQKFPLNLVKGNVNGLFVIYSWDNSFVVGTPLKVKMFYFHAFLKSSSDYIWCKCEVGSNMEK